jgi:hypothetical protein
MLHTDSMGMHAPVQSSQGTGTCQCPWSTMVLLNVAVITIRTCTQMVSCSHVPGFNGVVLMIPSRLLLVFGKTKLACMVLTATQESLAL